MDETQMEELKRALVVIGENIAAAVDGIKDAIAAMQAVGGLTADVQSNG
jgi:hypothetical protein